MEAKAGEAKEKEEAGLEAEQSGGAGSVGLRST
jgi:hypothetical protein